MLATPPPPLAVRNFVARNTRTLAGLGGAGIAAFPLGSAAFVAGVIALTTWLAISALAFAACGVVVAMGLLADDRGPVA